VQLAACAHVHSALFHTDAAQAAGEVSFDVEATAIDMLSLPAHKSADRRASARAFPYLLHLYMGSAYLDASL
jgi:hypothetical protein